MDLIKSCRGDNYPEMEGHAITKAIRQRI